MSKNFEFNGFSKETIQFYRDLEQNNNKLWFEAHKNDFEHYVMDPAKDFVVTLGTSLQTIAPEVHADPRVNKSIFRIYRDTRFSKDKSPYKTNLALWFWVGNKAKFESPGYYFHLDAQKLMLGAGIHTFSKELLKAYREAVVQPQLGASLPLALQDLSKKGDYNIGGKHYKRIPRGYDQDQANAELLLYNGLTVGIESDIPEAFFSKELVAYCMERYKEMAPVVDWLSQMVQLAPEPVS